ncbi:MAG: cupin domain-containing protein [Planctomycetota bacterium]|nr:cupin domain-containing protein [Planctomycetota bacterium]
MASIWIQDEQRRLEDAGAVRAFLEPYGIWHERWDVAGRVGAGATDAQILDAYAPEIERLKARGGYRTADVINVTPQTPGLQAMLDKFNKEHTHRDDEVRFIVHGRGIFHIHGKPGSADEKVFAIHVEAGDLINVPAGTRHWFDLCEDREIRAIRLFVDPAGWSPEYAEAGVHAKYEPICFGPSYFPSGGRSVAPLQV